MASLVWGFSLALAALAWLLLLPSSVRGVEWQPPLQSRLNNLTWALHGSGVNGFIYNSSYTPPDRYGAYNWCNMPHVRRAEYPQPGPEWELRYVELMHRHHKRTPYPSNGFPIEPYPWNCDDVWLSLRAQPLPGPEPAAAHRQAFESAVNPFAAPGWTGTCAFPQITAQGLLDSWQHGADLYAVYHDLLGLVPASDSSQFASAVRYRVTNNVITSQVAAMVVSAMCKSQQQGQSLPLLVQAPGIDSLEPQYSCPSASNLFDAIRSDASWRQHLDASANLFRTLDAISGVPESDAGFHASLDHYYDNLSARQCHQKPLPCSTTSAKCVTQELADTVYRLGNWEYSQLYRDHPSSLPASAASLGVWIGELTTHLRDVIAGRQHDVVYYHNVAHDGSVSRLLSILQLDQMVWPGMGAEVVFELWRHKESDFVRVLFGGKILRSSHPDLGLMDMLPAEDVLGYLEELVGQGANRVKAKCKEQKAL
ncbi:hypothetical protein CDD81_8155 [Ophiocordyceps australis]|uniref:Acid phosphatase n=1 Tax=Ophiocordyceps australis TaxID=1399860 RepID=A0A2C5Y3P2_9HYPO|nr:hypothetical protein CDD81_8155 [Ophiocordyceps australis]